LRVDDLLRVSLRQVIRHRRRYWGVVLAIALGVAGFIAIITMGQDVKRNFNQDLDLIGGVTIIRTQFEQRPQFHRNWFRPATVAAIRRLPGVREASLVGHTQTEIRWGTRQEPVIMVAVDEYFWSVRSYAALQGALFGAREVAGRQRVVALGPRLAQRLFGTGEAAGRTLEMHQDLFQVTGTVGNLGDVDLEKSAFMPLTTAQDRFGDLMLPDRLYVRCTTWDDVPGVAAAIPAAVHAHQSPELLQVEVSWNILDHVKRVAWWIEFFVYLAIASTLVLGGIGIWNVMMAAVRSRTREIGLKKAMGAEDSDILAQFLTEALCLSLTSAVLGVILGRLLVEVLGVWIGRRPPEEQFLTCLGLSLVFAVVIGVASGLYPSLQAARMEVVSATRYE
jgi:putative ABC transport system permease protein